LREEHQISLTQMQQIRDLKEQLKMLQQSDEEHSHKLWETHKLRESTLKDKEDNCAAALKEALGRVQLFEDRVRQLEAREKHQAYAMKGEHMQQIRGLKKQIKLLQQSDEEHSHKLREANNIRQRAVQDKEDSCMAIDEATDCVRRLEDEVKKLKAQEEEDQLSLVSYKQQINELKKKIEQQQQSNKGHTQAALKEAEDRICQFEERIRQLEAREEHQTSMVKQEHHTSLTYVQQIRELKTQIERLQHSNEDHTQKLWEANKLRERVLQDKEDDIAHELRTLRLKNDKALRAKEDSHLEELRACKKKSELSFFECKKELTEGYRQTLLDAKKREQTLTEKEDALQKELSDEKMKGSFSETQITTLLRQKDEEYTEGVHTIIKEKDTEFEREVAKLHSEINRLRKQGEEANEDKMMANELETQLLECKKELTQQRRKHRSEMNKLSNTMELRKSKEGRLQSHIQSLEKQISDMVNDYELKLQESSYGGT